LGTSYDDDDDGDDVNGLTNIYHYFVSATVHVFVQDTRIVDTPNIPSRIMVRLHNYRYNIRIYILRHQSIKTSKHTTHIHTELVFFLDVYRYFDM